MDWFKMGYQIIMFHKEYYPTPVHVLEMMQLDCADKIVLDPHAGTGAILEFAVLMGAKRIQAIEINETCQRVLKDKEIQLIGEDWLQTKGEDISHVDCIYMNPPFSNAHEHILHAWKIAPEGCEIVSLCNYETIEKANYYRRLAQLLRDHAITSNLGLVFVDAERDASTTEIGLIKLYKPIVSNGFEYDGFFMDEEEEESQQIGITEFNEVRAVVNTYVATMKAFDVMRDQVTYLNSILGHINISGITMNLGYDKSITTKEDFSRIVQKESWNYIFKKLNMQKYVTSGVMKDINKFVETQSRVPFTMKNIYRMLQIIVGTRQNTFNRALEEAIDNFTRHTHENRFNVAGWKTNTGHMLNKKFIVENICEQSYRHENGLKIKYSTYGGDKINDLVKVLCNITAKNYDTIGRLDDLSKHNDNKEGESFKIWSNTWYNYGFFEVKFFKKGTMHVKFKDLNDWYLLNRAYGELKGFSLPEQHKK